MKLLRTLFEVQPVENAQAGAFTLELQGVKLSRFNQRGLSPTSFQVMCSTFSSKVTRYFANHTTSDFMHDRV